MNNGFKLYGLRHLLNMRGISCYELSDMMGKHAGYRTNLNKLRNLQKGCTHKTVANICKALDCDPIDLIEQPSLVKSVNQFNVLISQYIRDLASMKAYTDR